jgi:putative FmdB family regulatory protein
MKRVFDFECQQCGETTEEYTEYKQTSSCPLCGGLAVKLISAPQIKLEGITGSFPGAYDAWERKHIQKLKQEQKRKSE